MTLTGAVRWSAPRRRVGRRYAVGLEWFPLGETARYRLRTCLVNRLPDAMRRSLAYRTGMLIGLVGLACAGWALLSIYRENRRLLASLEQRRAIIRNLEDQERQSLKEVIRLRREVHHLEGTVGLLQRPMERTQAGQAPSDVPATLASTDPAP